MLRDITAKYDADDNITLNEVIDNYLALSDIVINATTVDEVRRACAAAAASPEPVKKKTRGKRG